MNKLTFIYQNFLVRYERILFLTGLGGLALFLPLLPYATSVAQFWLLGHWLFTGNYAQKIHRLKTNRLTVLFISIYLVHLLGMSYSGNWDYGLNDLQRKLPLLVIPLMLASNKALSTKELHLILHLFVFGVLVSSIVSYLNYLGVGGFTYANIREISAIFSHIRLALFVCMSIAILLWLIQCVPKKRRLWIYGLMIAWLFYFILILESFTGILLGSIVLVLFFGKKLFNSFLSRWTKVAFIVVVFAPVFFLGVQVFRVYQLMLPKTYSSFAGPVNITENGNQYHHDLDNPQRENGYYVWRYIQDEEMITEWDKRSEVALKDSNNQAKNSYYILVRYLSSLGLKKDSAGVWQLSETDINHIEAGVPNWIFSLNNPVLTRVYKIFWEIESFRRGTDPTFQSISQRMVFLSTGWEIFTENLLIGTGTGNVWITFRNKYEQSGIFREIHPWMRAHNQYLTFLLTFGIFGGGWILFVLFYPVWLQRRTMVFPALAFFVIAFLSMLTEDTLESQAGVIFFSYFYSLFFLNKSEVNCLK